MGALEELIKRKKEIAHKISNLQAGKKIGENFKDLEEEWNQIENIIESFIDSNIE